MADVHSRLLAMLHRCEGETLLVADENTLDFPFAFVDKSVSVITNRFDVAARADSCGLASRFSDFDFGAAGNSGIDNIVYRISKEKAVVHHIANQAGRHLAENGSLWLVGGKQEGIKTFAKTIGKAFGDAAHPAKEGQYYSARIRKCVPEPENLDDRDYCRLREIFRLAGKPVVSKPGQFGWDSVDSGSHLLADYLPSFLATADRNAGLSVLDLGCGYGYLSLMAHQLGRFAFSATDNCAAALISCRENFQRHGISGDVIADDCASGITGPFDIVLCNPPFHQGFQQERKLTEKFLAATRRLLKKDGKALFVVNEFVPLESLAGELFRRIETPVKSGGFKLVMLGLPGARPAGSPPVKAGAPPFDCQ